VSEKKIRICHLDDLADPDSRAFSLLHHDTAIEGFVVRCGERVTAFVNSCPHTGATLNWNPHQFLDVAGEFIQCSMHGALFRLNDGFCVRGPCVGQSLLSLRVTLQQGVIWVNCD
jgi:nitrite reductase/ring-hydroxylating ferredoxin subunit